MKAMYIAAVAALSVLGLAGCGNGPVERERSLAYYEDHIQTAVQVKDACEKNKPISKVQRHDCAMAKLAIFEHLGPIPGVPTHSTLNTLTKNLDGKS